MFEPEQFDYVGARDKLIGFGILMGPLIALVVIGAIVP